jgi:uncharacterized protein
MFGITTWVLNNPRKTIIMSLLIVVFFGVFARKVEKDNRMDHWIPKDNPIRKYYAEEFREQFNQEEKIIVGIIHEDGDVLNPSTLAKLKRITKKLGKMSLLDDIVSLQNVEFISSSVGSLDVKPMFKRVPQTPEEIESLRAKIVDNDMIYGHLISKDFKGTLIIAEPTFDFSKSDQSEECFAQIKEIINPEQGPEKIVFAGFPANIATANRMMSEDLAFLIPMVMVVIMLMLLAFFRSARGVFLPLTIVVSAMAITFGLMAILNEKISIIGTSLPVALAAISIADGIHILSEYYHNFARNHNCRSAIEETMRNMNTPVIMTSLTTIGGFLSLATSNLTVVRQYGYFMSLGVFVAMVFSLTLIPALLILLPDPKKVKDAEAQRSTIFTIIGEKLASFSTRHHVATIIIFSVVFVLSIYGTMKVKVLQDFIDQFKEGTELRTADSLINKYITGTSTLWVILETNRENGAKDPAFLAKVEQLQDYIIQIDTVANASSLVDYIKRMNYVLHDQDPAYNRLPFAIEKDAVIDPDTGEEQIEETPGEQVVGQLLLLYEISGGELISKQIDSDYSALNISSTLHAGDTSEFEIITNDIEARAKEIFGDEVEFKTTGMVDIMKEVVRLVVRGQVRSLITSFIGVMIMLMIVFRSVKAGIIGMLPLVLTVLTNFTLMTLLDIPLNIGTSLIASIGIGIGVDYAVHVIARYRLVVGQTSDPDQAISETIHTTGRAVILNALAVMFGHMVLMFSNFVPIIYIGLLVGFTMFMSAFGALTILPTALKITKFSKGK